VAAPAADEAARAVFAKKKNLRLLITGDLPDPARPGLNIKNIAGGIYIVQTRDNGQISETDLKVVTKRAPSEQELKDCLFAWTIAKHTKSNAIVYAKDGVTAGIGAGQMNRRDSARIAAIKAKEAAETYGWDAPKTVGSAVASDAFFPFADGLLSAAEAGATAVIQPGGSMRDDEVIAAANEHGPGDGLHRDAPLPALIRAGQCPPAQLGAMGGRAAGMRMPAAAADACPDLLRGHMVCASSRQLGV
jgi:phosphoribosylaminoimidazolecarboxamide formyltransferase/IMP cyclohydrolase